MELQEISVESNALTGSIPLAIFNMSSLKRMGLTSNKLSGSLPDNICQNLPRLQEVVFDSNRLIGSIPSQWLQCKALLYLSFSSNRFTGSIPTSVGNLTQLKGIYFDENNLKGIFHTYICG